MRKNKIRGGVAIGGALLIGAIAMAGSVAFGSATSGATGHRPTAARAASRGDFRPFHNKLSSNTNGWCTGVGQPCDGVVYGTIDIVKQSFSNGGGSNYGVSVASPVGQGNKYARLSGGGTGSGGYLTGPAGCPVPGGENCTGAYTLWGTGGTSKVFSPFSTTIKIYVDSVWAAAHPGQVVDWDTALNTNTGGFLSDFAFNMCSTAAGGGGFYVDDSQGAGGCASPTDPNYIGALTTAGWYTFNHQFTNVGGTLYTHYSILNSANAVVASYTLNTGFPIATVGGPLYGWFPDEDVNGLPVANSQLTKP